MNRRNFLLMSAGLSAALVSSAIWFSQSSRKSINHISFSKLPANIQALYKQEFTKAFPSLSLKDLIAMLSEKGIYKKGEFHTSQIRANAINDPMVEFNNFYYTQSELILYATVARLR